MQVILAGVYFINILSERFLNKSASLSFSLVKFWLWQKDFGKKTLSYEKHACKILMKLTTKVHILVKEMICP